MTDSIAKELAEAGGHDCRDAILYRTRGSESPRLVNLFNLMSRSLTDGLVMNSARAGLGTTNPVGASIPGESYYYQGLRAFSAFDWEFQRQILSAEAWPLPTSATLIAGRFPRDFAEGFADEHLEPVLKAQRVARTLAPSLETFEFRRLDADDYTVADNPRRVVFSGAIREQLWRGTAEKLLQIEKRAGEPNFCEVQDKLQTMIGAFAPLSTVYVASFDPDDHANSFTRLTMYLPAYHTLHADDVDDPSSWYLARGLETTALPQSIQIRAAQLSHISYLRDADRSQQQAIKMEVRRDFSDPRRVTLEVGFGRLFNDALSDLYGFDKTDHRDALHVVFRAHLPAADEDSAPVRAAKESFNHLLGGFEVEARVHQLTIHLMRQSGPTGEGADEVLVPNFSLEDSKISFRAHRYTSSNVECMSLKAAGFACEPATERPGFHCWRDFWTWNNLKDFLSGGGQEKVGGFAGMFVAGREKLFEQVVGRATKLVLDQSMGSIEEALDEELARIASEYLERYQAARDVLSERLHSGLF